MPLVRRWRRLGFAGQLAVLLTVSLVVIASLVISIAAQWTANSAAGQAKNAAGQAGNAAKQAQSTANCVNDVLGNRNGPQAKDAQAHIAYAHADKRFSDALADVLTLPNGSQQQRDAYDRFVTVARQKKAADDKYVRVLVADQGERDAHPFGKC